MIDSSAISWIADAARAFGHGRSWDLPTIRVSRAPAATQVAQPRIWTKEASPPEEHRDEQARGVRDGHDQHGEADRRLPGAVAAELAGQGVGDHAQDEAR